MPCHTGEVHPGGAGKPGAVQKVFRPGAEAEQQKHEGVVWSIHGEYCLITSASYGLYRMDTIYQPVHAILLTRHAFPINMAQCHEHTSLATVVI